MALAQTNDSAIVVYGKVLDARSKKPISNAHIVNKRNFIGTVSSPTGYFYMELLKGDSIVVSSLGYEFYYYVTHIEPIGLVDILMKEKIYLLNDIDLSTYKLSSNDPKEVKLGKPMVPKNSDIRYPNAIKPTIANPVDLLYHMFSNKTRQLKVLRELQAQDRYKAKLQSGNNREILTNLTGLEKDELEQFLFFCKHSRAQISTMNDYALLMSLMQCYSEYLRIKEREDILKEYEQGDSKATERFK